MSMRGEIISNEYKSMVFVHDKTEKNMRVMLAILRI